MQGCVRIFGLSRFEYLRMTASLIVAYCGLKRYPITFVLASSGLPLLDLTYSVPSSVIHFRLAVILTHKTKVTSLDDSSCLKTLRARFNIFCPLTVEALLWTSLYLPIFKTGQLSPNYVGVFAPMLDMRRYMICCSDFFKHCFLKFLPNDSRFSDNYERDRSFHPSKKLKWPLFWQKRDHFWTKKILYSIW